MKEIILQAVNVLLQSAFFSFSLITLSKTIFDKNYSKKTILLTVLLVLLETTLASTTKNIFPFLNTIVGISCSFFIGIFVLKIPKTKSFLIVFSNFVLMFISELVSFYSISLILNKTTAEISSNVILYLLLIIIMYTIDFVVIISISNLLIKKLNLKTIKTNFSNNQLLRIIFILLIATLPQMITFILNGYSYPKSILIINCTQMLLFCLTIFSYFKITMQKEKAESDLELSELHNKTMVNMVDGVRTLKHDYNNIMQALNGYVSTKQYDKLQEHINKVLDECNIVNNLSIVDQKIFNDPAIYGIVGAKYFLALEADIKFEFDIVTNIKEINFSMPELSRILGIVLDNAIEATQKTEEKYIKLEMKYDNRKDADIIKVYNTYDTNINIDLKEIYEKGVSSKKVKSGIGLWEVKKLINKSKNSQIYATIEQNMFVQNIIIEKTL